MTGGKEYGVRGYIHSYDLTGVVNDGNMNFSNEHYTAISSAGIEVGWYIGYGSDNQAFVTSPHAYVTLNGDGEIDSGAVGVSDYWYSTWWSGSTQEWDIRLTHGGTDFWGGHQIAADSGPGTIVALGEVKEVTDPMQGEFTGDSAIEYFNGSAWHDWSGLSLCADSGFTSSGNVDDVTDS